MTGNDYLDKNFPESDFEDGNFTDDTLYDGIATAYEAGKKDTLKFVTEWLKMYAEDFALPCSETGKVYADDMVDSLLEDIENEEAWNDLGCTYK